MSLLKKMLQWKNAGLSALACAMLCASMSGMCGAASAAEAKTVDITIDGAGNTYKAYRLLDLTTSLKTGDAHTAHDGTPHSPDCYNYAYTVNGATYRDILRSALNLDATADDAKIIDTIGKMDDNSADVQAFANSVYAQVKDKVNPDETAGRDKTFANVDQGYWLIVETETTGDNDAKSLVMLDTAGQEDITVESKESVPTLTKKVYEDGWKKNGDADIGDTVRFQLKGTMPENIASYKTYKYVFHDTLGAGYTFNADSVSVSVNGAETADYTLTTACADGCSFEVAMFFDVTNDHITAGTEVVVEYEAVLDGANVQYGSAGNTNSAKLEFSNDPYASGEGDSTTTTPPSTSISFTYKLQVNKVDGAGNALKGAEFKLQKNEDGTWKDYKTLPLTEEVSEFQFNGLDAGLYKLVETKTPDGYNKADDIEFEVVSTIDDSGLTSLSVKRGEDTVSGPDKEFEVSLSDGNIVTAVVNNTGVRLPITGGTGVYILYGIGATAILAAGAVIVIRKRKQAEAN